MFDKLPFELNNLIVSYTNQKELAALSLVCRRMNQIASNHLYQSITISSNKSSNGVPSMCLITKEKNFSNKYESLIPYFQNNRNLYRIKSVQILNINDYLFNYDESLIDFIKFLLQNCPNMTKLETPFKFDLFELTDPYDINLENLNIISSNLSNLVVERLNVKVPNLKKLNVMINNSYNLVNGSSFIEQIDNLYLTLMAANTPALKEFYLNTNDIYGIRPDFVNYLSHLFISNSQKPLSLTNLKLSFSHDSNFLKSNDEFSQSFQKTGKMDFEFFKSLNRIFRLSSVEKLSLNVICNKTDCNCDEQFFNNLSKLSFPHLNSLKIESTISHSNDKFLRLLSKVSDIEEFEFSNGIFNNLEKNRCTNLPDFINVLKTFKSLKHCNLVSLLVNLNYNCKCFKCMANYQSNAKFNSLTENYFNYDSDTDSDYNSDSNDEDEEEEELSFQKSSTFVTQIKQSFRSLSPLSSLQPLTSISSSSPRIGTPIQLQRIQSSITLSRIPSLNLISTLNSGSDTSSGSKLHKFNELIYHLYQNNFKNYYNCPFDSDLNNFINFYDEFNFENGFNRYNFSEKNFIEILNILLHSVIPYINELNLDILHSLNIGGLNFEVGACSETDEKYISLKNFSGIEKIYL